MYNSCMGRTNVHLTDNSDLRLPYQQVTELTISEPRPTPQGTAFTRYQSPKRESANRSQYKSDVRPAANDVFEN